MTIPPIPNQTPLRPGYAGRFHYEPMPEGKSPALLIEALLKYPGRIIHELHNNRRAPLCLGLLGLALVGFALYGVVVGSFTGGAQLWIAPAKLALGAFFSVLICLPSLYIFACLNGIDARLRTVSGVLFAAVGLGALLLIGFAPVAWIFSQSTDSVPFMGALHIGLWAIGMLFGLRMIEALGFFLTGSVRRHFKLWGAIFILVCVQMMTTLRPIMVPGATFFPAEKKFFLANWFESMNPPKKPEQ